MQHTAGDELIEAVTRSFQLFAQAQQAGDVMVMLDRKTLGRVVAAAAMWLEQADG